MPMGFESIEAITAKMHHGTWIATWFEISNFFQEFAYLMGDDPIAVGLGGFEEVYNLHRLHRLQTGHGRKVVGSIYWRYFNKE